MCLQSCAARTTSANAKWDKADITLYDPSVPGSAPSKALKTLVRQGIPDDLRPHLWLLFSGGLAKKRASPPGHFAMLQRKAALATSGVHLFSSCIQFPVMKSPAASVGRHCVRALSNVPFSCPCWYKSLKVSWRNVAA